MNRLDILQKIIQQTNAQTYLEIGVQMGKILFKIKAPNKIGIDPKFLFPTKTKIKRLLGLVSANTFEMPSDDFFEKHADKVLKNGIDVALVDGLHTYDQALRDVENCLKYLNPNGVIMMHDCNPNNSANAYPVKHSIDEVLELAKKGEVAGWNGRWNGDVWKTVAHLRIQRDDINVFTFDLDWGLGIVTKGTPESKLNSYTIKDIEESDYSILEKDRQNILNLRHPKHIGEFVASLKKA